MPQSVGTGIASRLFWISLRWVDMKTSAFRHFAALVVGALTLVCGGIAMGQDLSNGPVGRIAFLSSSPEHHWAIIRGRLGPPQKVWATFCLPDRKFEGKLPVVVMSHGSEGLDYSYSGNIYRDIWAPPTKRRRIRGLHCRQPRPTRLRPRHGA